MAGLMKKKILYYLPLFLLAAFFLWANRTSFLAADDYCSLYNTAADGILVPITDVMGCVENTVKGFFGNGGRSFCVFINALSLLIGYDLFKIIAGPVIALQAYIIVKWFNSDNYLVPWCVCLSMFMLPYAVFYELFLWHTGFYFYTVPTLCILMLLTPFVYKLQGREFLIKNPLLRYAYYSLAIIGSSFIPEDYSITAVAVCWFVVIIDSIKNRKIDKKLVAIAAIHLLFTACSISAPGNFKRAGDESGRFGISVFTLIRYFDYQYTYSPAVTIIFLTSVIAMLFCVLNSSKKERIISCLSALFMLPALAVCITNTVWVYPIFNVNSTFISIFRAPKEHFAWFADYLQMHIVFVYFLLLTVLLLVIFIKVSLTRKDPVLFVFLLLSTMPLLSLIVVGASVEQRVAYLANVATCALSIYIALYYTSTMNKKAIVVLFVVLSVLMSYYHTEYLVDNIKNVPVRQSLLENAKHTDGDIELPYIRANVHGNIDELSWDIDLIRLYYGIDESRNIRTVK